MDKETQALLDKDFRRDIIEAIIFILWLPLLVIGVFVLTVMLGM